MVYTFGRRESPESLIKVIKNEVVRPSLIPRHKSEPLMNLSPEIAAKYEDKACRNKSPSRRQISTNSSERRGTLIRRKSTKDKAGISKGILVESSLNDKSFSNDKSQCTDKYTSNFASCEYEKTSSKTRTKTKAKKLSKAMALFDAILDNDFSLVRKFIITDQMDVDEVNLEGNTGLHVAAAAGHLECMQLLIECGSRINIVDNCLRTPLEYAVLYGNFDCATLLIEHGADTSLIRDGIL